MIQKLRGGGGISALEVVDPVAFAAAAAVIGIAATVLVT